MKRRHFALSRRSSKLGLALSLVSLPALTASGSAPAGGQLAEPVVLPAKQVTTDLRPGRAFNQPQLALSPNDKNTFVIAGANYNAGECVAFASLDGGQTWRAGKEIGRASGRERVYVIV
jgi:hypothetical protein